MTFTFKGKPYETKKIKVGEWMDVLQLRKEANESGDELQQWQAIIKWLKTAMVITDEEIKQLEEDDCFGLLRAYIEHRVVPLKSGEKSQEPLSPTVLTQ